MGIEHLTILSPTVVSSFDFQGENSGRTVQYKLNAQSLRHFSLHKDVNDAHRGAYCPKCSACSFEHLDTTCPQS